MPQKQHRRLAVRAEGAMNWSMPEFYRVLRGGGWFSVRQYALFSQRGDIGPSYKGEYLGLRLVRRTA